MTKIKKKISKMQVLETERLILRKFLPRDADDMYEYSSNPETTKFLTWLPHESLVYTKEYLRFIIKKYKTGEFLDWGITLKSNGKFIGTCGFTSVDFENSRAEIGYVLNPSYQKNGYAVEAVKRVLDYSFYDLEFNRVEAKVMEGNEPSISLLKKIGMRHEGTFKKELYIKGEFKNIMHFAICREEYK